MVSKSWVKGLIKELNSLVEAKIIGPEQADRIRAKYSKQLEYNKLLSSIFILGSILVGLGLILFIASNWLYLGKIFKISLVFAFIIGFNLLGYLFRFEKKNLPKLGDALLFLGAVCFGAGIWLIAQVFQIPYNYANGLLFWILGILPIIVFFRSKSILVLASILTPIWLIVVIANNPLSIFYPFLLLFTVILDLAYREKQKAALIISLLGLGIWLQHFLYIQLRGIAVSLTSMHLLYTNMFIAYGFILYYIGMLHIYHKDIARFSIIYKLLGIIFILFNNFSLTFTYHYGTSFSFTKTSIVTVHPTLASSIIYILYLAALMISSGYVFSTQSARENREARIIFVFLVFQFICMHLGLLYNNIVSLSYNILLFAEAVTFLYIGYLVLEELIFRIALYMFALDIFTRYFDTFWKLLPRSIFFMAGGLILILGGVYTEGKRKSVEKKIKVLAEQKA